jgi:hypothetical protein
VSENRKKFRCGGLVFLLGVLQILGVFCMVNCGEFVVGCVVNVVIKRPLFSVRKIRHVFEVYF